MPGDRPLCPVCRGTLKRMSVGGEVPCTNCEGGYMRGIDDMSPEEIRIADLQAELAAARARIDEMGREALERNARLLELEGLINTPETLDFIDGVRREVAHQRERWGTDHDAGKTDADWFWLIGYLAGKALHKPEKRLHHLITTAAALCNWHAFTIGKTNMRPGIAPPAATEPERAP